MTHKKKLIEVALPLEAINKESLRRKQKAPKGWPASFHKWWSQKPLAAGRAVIFAQMVDDPSAYPDLFPTIKKQEKERQRLIRIIEDLVRWDNTSNSALLQSARDEIWRSWRRACAEYADHPRSRQLFDRSRLPSFSDPFAGSGSLPLCGQWLGLETHSSDLNPVSVVITKAAIEIPSKFAGNAPVHPAASQRDLPLAREWKNAQGLAEDVRHYAHWMRTEAEKRIGHLYPEVAITSELARDRPDLTQYVGQSLAVTAFLWARTVRSPNPAFADVEVPLASTFIFSTKAGREAYVEPIIGERQYRFTVRMGAASDADSFQNGTKLSRGAHFKCLMSGTPIEPEYVYREANAGRMGTRLLAIVAEARGGRLYLAPTTELEQVALSAAPYWGPDVEMPDNPRWFSPPLYGLKTYSSLFTPRQLLALSTFADLVSEARSIIRRDAVSVGLPDDDTPLSKDGAGAQAYADAIAVYLACVVDRMAYYGSSLSTWLPKDNALRDAMPRQALAMTWEFAEGNPLGKSSGDVSTCANAVSNYLDVATPNARGWAVQRIAQTLDDRDSKYVISTDPPYYDNIGYADLSDYFYVWLRRSLRSVFPDLFSTVVVPKAEELVATPYRHGGKKEAEKFFLEGMTEAMHRLAESAHPAFPVTIYYAFKQAESETDAGTASTGWETFLAAVISAGFAITGTWPLRTEGAGRLLANNTNALASSIVLVCRPRRSDAPTTTRREFVAALKGELPESLRLLQAENIAPVDLAQASIGPGMAVYTRYDKVLDAEGKSLGVRDALALINQALDEALAEQEGDFDADSRWALTWFEQSGFANGEYGVAEQLSKSKNTSVAGMVEAGIIESKRSKVRLLKPNELAVGWDPTSAPRVTAWETVHQLVRALEAGGEGAAAELLSKLGAKAEVAREFAYRLFSLCERKKRAPEALSYNALVQSWPEINRLARQLDRPAAAEQSDLFGDDEE